MPLSNCIIPIQAKLDEMQGYGYQQQPVGALQALLSPANRSMAKARFLREDGLSKKYQITYVPADCTAPTDCSVTAPDICAAGTSGAVTTTELTIAGCLNSGVIELTIAQFRDLCNFSPADFTIAQIQRKMDVFRRAINAAVLADICGYVGAFSSTVAGPKDLPLINTTNGSPNLIAETEILSDFSDAGMGVNPLIIGGRSWNIYKAAVNRGGVNDAGLNIGAADGANMAFYDNQLQGVCGTALRETSIAFAPQVIHFVNYLENAGDFQANVGINQDNALSFLQDGDTYHFGVIRDPVTGMYYDFNAVFDTCTKKWKLSFSSRFDTWKMPLTQCFFAGFTGVVKYNLCPYTLACP